MQYTRVSCHATFLHIENGTPHVIEPGTAKCKRRLSPTIGQARCATARRMPSDEAYGRYDHQGTPRTLYRVGPPVLLHCGGSTSPAMCVPRRARSVLRPS